MTDVFAVDANPTSGRRAVIGVVLLVLVAPIVCLTALWVSIHRVPTQADVQALLRDADRIEIYPAKAEAPAERRVLTEPTARGQLADTLQFQSIFWWVGREPGAGWVIECHAGDRKTLVVDLRDDGCLHLRKASRWYRMPVTPAFQQTVDQLCPEARK